jgi:sialate O-acetylesterase
MKFIRLLLLAIAFVTTAHAGITLAPLFTDNAVLQQGAPVTVWGWADDNEKVTVSFRGQKHTATSRLGKWSLQLRRMKAGGPDEMRVFSATSSVRLTNIMVGEVWLCGGQSNMEWPLGKTHDPEAAIAAATNTLIRFFNVPNTKSDAPSTRANARWQLCSPDVARGNTAVGYYFGRALHATRGVAIGLIQSDWGGTPAEAWMSRESLEMNPRYQSEILDGYMDAMRKHREATLAFEIEKAEAAKTGAEFKKRGPFQPWKPSELYQGMIAPLIPYAIKGAIWYQGESNAERAEQYRTLFPDMIRNWRRDFAQGDFPFLLVQLAPFKDVSATPQESSWAELREAQFMSTRTLPNVAMAVITDAGDPKDIHPQKKLPVGERLALAARAMAYGERITSSGPLYTGATFKDGAAIVQFEHVGRGLEARDGELKGFAVCGDDRTFVWARAEIVGDKVVVSSPEVPKPVAVRYGWADCPVVNLWNKDGLPASPFRSDSFPMVTAPKK